MESTASGEVVTHLFPALGPALVISMGYIDLGKWLAAVDGGARFGNDLVLLVLFFNLIAIMCQYLAACVGIVTGKSLAEICITEYPGPASMILGIQAEISMITSDLTMILGLSYGFNLLLGINLLSCICLAAAGSVLLPLFSDFLNYRKAEFVYVTLSALALLLYVLGVLISQPEIPLGKNVMFPKLSGESAYSLMAFLGANLMAHNFYIHSSIVRQQKRILGVRVGALLHDHFFAILFIFTGISLVNYVLMNSAAAVFGSTDIELNFDDLSLLMDQIFRIPIAPIAIFLVLLFSSQITSSAWNTDGPKLLTHSFGKNVSVWEHVLIVKAFSVVPALGFATFGGAEGVYQFLIFCQVVHGTLLPSSVIPLFRVASSRSIMGAFKMPWYLEIMSLLAFLGMLASNVIFIIEMLFGNSNWINDLRGSVGGTVTFAGILLAACGSMFFTLYLAVTPLKSASDMPETEVGTVGSPKDKLEVPEGREDDIQEKDKLEVPEGREDDIQEKITTSIDQFALEPGVLLESHLDQSDTTFDSDNDRHQKTDTSGASDMVVDSDHDSHQPNHGLSTPDTFVTPIFQTKEPMSINVVDLETVNDESATILLNPGVLERERHEFVAMPKDDVLDTNLPINKDPSEIVVPKEPIGEPPPVGESVVDSLLPSTSEDSGSSNIEKVKVSDGGVGSGSLSKLSGLGRAARRQLAVTLDEFWGHLFDFHGKPTPEAGAQKYDALLGLEVKNVSSTKVEIGTELSTNLRADVDRAPVFQLNQMEYSSPKLKSLCNADLSYGFQMGSSSRSRNMQVLNTSVQNASNSLLEPNERRYSSLYLPQYSNNHDYQPATVHGYQITSYLKQIGAGRNPYSPNVAPESPRISKSGIRVPPGFGDSVPYSDRQNGLGSLATSSLQSPTASRVSRGQVEGPYFDPSLIEPSYNTGPSAHSKKYHSSPDISALIAASRNYYLNESKLGGPIGPSPSAGRVAAKQQQYLNPISKTGVSSAFDELYPTNLPRKVFSPQPQLNTDTFWSRQPFEQLFGVPGMEPNRGVRMVTDKFGRAPLETFSYAESEVKLLQSLRVCISKLLKMEGSDWLFRPNSGCDEELIFLVSTQCKVGVDDINQLDSGELHLPLGSVNRIEEADIADIMSLPNCAEGCIWRASLVVSFGVWCVHRILELSLVESRPELWGKYTYVLNRLQGILDLAFSKPRETLSVCSCFDVLPEAKPIKGSFTTASTILEIIKDVEIAVSGRKGRTGTAAGDVAFPKGKENLASVLKRYKRRLSNKTTGTQDASSRKIHTASVL